MNDKHLHTNYFSFLPHGDLMEKLENIYSDYIFNFNDEQYFDFYKLN